jgi:hypothetical protein
MGSDEFEIVQGSSKEKDENKLSPKKNSEHTRTPNMPDRRKTPRAKNGKKKEVSPMWSIGLLVLLSIGILFAINSRKQTIQGSVKGVEVNSDRLKDNEEAKQGLQQNDGNSQKERQEKSDENKEPSEEKEKSNLDKDEQKPPSSQPSEVEGNTAGKKGTLDDRKIQGTPDDLNRQAWKALHGNEPELAVRFFTAVLKQQPNHEQSNPGLGKAYEALGKSDLAGKQYCQTAKLPNLSDADRLYWQSNAKQIGIVCK